MKKFLAVLSLITIVLAVSCSSVFYGNISGRIIDEDTEAGIQNVTVYVYQDKSARDSAFENASKTGAQPTSGYYTTALTSQDGSFNISKIYWKTNSPEYGKTADKSEVYLMYFKEGYGEKGFSINSNTATIISESSGGGVGEEKIKRTENITDLTISVINILTNENITDSISTEIDVPEGVEKRKINDRSYEFITPRESDDPEISILWSFRDDKSKYIPTDEDGINLDKKPYDTLMLHDNPAVTLYAKPTEFNYPVIEGKLVPGGDTETKAVDNITVKLMKNGVEIASAMTENRPRVQGDESQHGSFTIEVPETEKLIIGDYKGKNPIYQENDISIVYSFNDKEKTAVVTFSANELIQGIKYISVSVPVEDTP